MRKRRIFAGSIVALLLSVSPLAAACDLSCAFAAMNSDCHAQQVGTQDSPSGDMKMDGMAMDGMAMPEIAHNQDQDEGSAILGANTEHPSIGEMGPCERQSCDGDSAVSANASHSLAPQHNFILAIFKIPGADSAPSLFHGARDDVAAHNGRDGSLFHLSLRI
jgi:hypothetical protein